MHIINKVAWWLFAAGLGAFVMWWRTLARSRSIRIWSFLSHHLGQSPFSTTQEEAMVLTVWYMDEQCNVASMSLDAFIELKKRHGGKRVPRDFTGKPLIFSLRMICEQHDSSCYLFDPKHGWKFNDFREREVNLGAATLSDADGRTQRVVVQRGSDNLAEDLYREIFNLIKAHKRVTDYRLTYAMHALALHLNLALGNAQQDDLVQLAIYFAQNPDTIFATTHQPDPKALFGFRHTVSRS